MQWIGLVKSIISKNLQAVSNMLCQNKITFDGGEECCGYCSYNNSGIVEKLLELFIDSLLLTITHHCYNINNVHYSVMSPVYITNMSQVF